MTLNAGLFPSPEPGCGVEYCPAGVSRRLPSGVKVSRLKNEVRVSFAYRLAFLTPERYPGFGDASIGITAGSGICAAGDCDLRIPEVEELNDDLLL